VEYQVAKKGRPKWATNVARTMEKKELPCPPNCPSKSDGTERDADGNITRTFSCKDYCPVKRR